MKKLVGDRISPSPTNAFPVKSGTWNFLQQSYIDIFAFLNIAFTGGTYIGGASAVTYIIYGCRATVSGGNTTISEGAVFFKGEVYYSPQQTIATPSGGNVIVANISISQYNTNADPILATGGGTFSIHDDRTIVYLSGGTGTGDFKDFSKFESIFGTWYLIGGAGTYSVAYSADFTVGNQSGFRNLSFKPENSGKSLRISGSCVCAGVSNSIVCTLPTIFRPKYNIRTQCLNTTTPTVLDIMTDGTVNVNGASISDIIFIDTIISLD